ncbi:MAG: hypothetical protein ABF243_05730 [Celeribacter marinus]
MTKRTDAEIDKIVDDLVGDHDVAEKLKTKLHDGPDVARVVPVETRENATDGDDDMWDNMPV